jgi:hypothetical protein
VVELQIRHILEVHAVDAHQTLFQGFQIRKCPGSFQDLWPRLIQPDDVIQARHDRQEVVRLGVATKVDGDAAVFVLPCRDVVIGIALSFLTGIKPLLCQPCLRAKMFEQNAPHFFYCEWVSLTGVPGADDIF